MSSTQSKLGISFLRIRKNILWDHDDILIYGRFSTLVAMMIFWIESAFCFKTKGNNLEIKFTVLFNFLNIWTFEAQKYYTVQMYLNATPFSIQMFQQRCKQILT